MRSIGKVCLIIGFLLVAGSLALLLSVRLTARQAESRNAAAVEIISSLLPPIQPGIKDTYSNMAMPTVEIDGTDYVALVDIPTLGLTLPVANDWHSVKVLSGPRRFDGTVYDGSLIVGGVDQPGQFSGFSLLQLGDTVTVTDMTGLAFHYVIDRIDRSTSASEEILTAGTADLTLFVRNAYNLDYILLRCVAE